MRRKYNHIQNVSDGNCCMNSASVSLRNSVYRQSSVVDEFYFETGIDPDSGAEVLTFSNPLYVLFNQQRLQELSPMALQQWLNQMDRAGNSELAKIKEKLTNEELHSLVRSRYIQHPADLQAYLEACNANIDKFTADIKAMQEEISAQQAAQQSSTSNTE